MSRLEFGSLARGKHHHRCPPARGPGNYARFHRQAGSLALTSNGHVTQTGRHHCRLTSNFSTCSREVGTSNMVARKVQMNGFVRQLFTRQPVCTLRRKYALGFGQQEHPATRGSLPRAAPIHAIGGRTGSNRWPNARLASRASLRQSSGATSNENAHETIQPLLATAGLQHEPGFARVRRPQGGFQSRRPPVAF